MERLWTPGARRSAPAPPGSTARKIPQAILEDYRVARWVPQAAAESAPAMAEAAEPEESTSEPAADASLRPRTSRHSRTRSDHGNRASMSAGDTISEWGEVDIDRIESASARLDLRRPNREALESIAWMSWHHFASGHHAPFEGVIESATGVGKTYIIAGALDYFAAQGIRNFAVIAPGEQS